MGGVSQRATYYPFSYIFQPASLTEILTHSNEIRRLVALVAQLIQVFALWRGFLCQPKKNKSNRFYYLWKLLLTSDSLVHLHGSSNFGEGDVMNF